MESSIILTILGGFLVVFGILDGLKYHWLADKVKLFRTAKGQSRNFINVALGKDIVFFLYLMFKPDGYLFLMTFLGFIFTIELFIYVYIFYPYKYRHLKNFKRPNILKYLWNSFLPNKKSTRL